MMQKKPENPELETLEDRKLKMTLALLFMELETADDPEAVRMEMMQAAIDAGKDPMWVIHWLINLGSER